MANQDVSAVHAKFDEHELPFDVLWLDIEHTDRKRYFSWDEDKFPTPLRMQAELAATGRKMVTIIDPHLKADDGFGVFTAARDAGLLVRKADNSAHFEGDCWPGRSAWLDYLQPAARLEQMADVALQSLGWVAGSYAAAHVAERADDVDDCGLTYLEQRPPKAKEFVACGNHTSRIGPRTHALLLAQQLVLAEEFVRLFHIPCEVDHGLGEILNQIH